MKKLATYNYTIGNHFASPLINLDYSGLDNDNDLKRLNCFLDNIAPSKGIHLVLDIGEEDSFFDRCDITGDMSDCCNLIVTYLGEV